MDVNEMKGVYEYFTRKVIPLLFLDCILQDRLFIHLLNFLQYYLFSQNSLNDRLSISGLSL